MAAASNQFLLAAGGISWGGKQLPAVMCAAGESVKCAHVLIPLQTVFKQSTRASERKLNFESVNQHTLSSLSASEHRWLDQSALHGLSALQMQSASTDGTRLPVGFCMWFCAQQLLW